MEVEDSTDGEQLGLPSVWWQLSPLWRLCALSLANCRDSAEEPPGLVEVAAEVWQKAFDACKEANRLAPPLSGSKRGALHVFLTTITAPVVRLDLRAEVRLTPDDLLAVAAAPALLAAQEVHLDLSELPQLSDHCLSRILTSLAANLVSLKLNVNTIPFSVCAEAALDQRAGDCAVGHVHQAGGALHARDATTLATASVPFGAGERWMPGVACSRFVVEHVDQEHHSPTDRQALVRFAKPRSLTGDYFQ